MKATATEGRLARVFRDAMVTWDQMKADGQPLEARVRGMTALLRDAWPFTRAWHYLCDGCADSGWMFGVCTPETPCGRPFRFPGQRINDHTGRGRCAPGHSYVRPCFCAKGQAFHAALYAAQSKPEDFAQAGKTKSPTRVGR